MIEKTTLQRFLNAYDMGGTAATAIEAANELLGFAEPFWTCDKTLAERLHKSTAEFDFNAVFVGRECSIIAELDNALQGLNGGDRERYLLRVLAHFDTVSALLYPKNETQQSRELWQAIRNADNACEGRNVFYIADMWLCALLNFADRLDSLLLTYGIDLDRLQAISGVIIRWRRNLSQIDTFIGSRDLAKHYLSLATAPAAPTATAGVLPAEVNTVPADELPFELQSAAKYFERARAAGYIVGNRWQKTDAQLGYFCFRAFPDPRPVTALMKYFEVFGLSTNITNAQFPAKMTKNKKWRAEMETAIFEE